LNNLVKKETDFNNFGTQNRENMRCGAYDHHTCKMQLLQHKQLFKEIICVINEVMNNLYLIFPGPEISDSGIPDRNFPVAILVYSDKLFHVISASLRRRHILVVYMLS